MSSRYDAGRDVILIEQFGIIEDSDSEEEGGGITRPSYNTQEHRHQDDIIKGNKREHNTYYDHKNVDQSSKSSDFYGSNEKDSSVMKIKDKKSTSQQNTSITELNKAFDNQLTCNTKQIHTAAAGEGISQGHRYDSSKRMTDCFGNQISSMDKEHTEEYDTHHDHRNEDNFTNTSDFYGCNEKFSSATTTNAEKLIKQQSSSITAQQAFDMQLTSDGHTKQIHTAAAGEGISQGHRYDSSKRMTDCFGTRISSMDKEHTEEYDTHHDHRNEDNFTNTSDFYGCNEKCSSATTTNTEKLIKQQSSSITAQQAFDMQLTSDGHTKQIQSAAAGEGISQGHRYDSSETSDCYGTQISSMDKEHTVEYDTHHDHRNEDNFTKNSEFFGKNEKYPTSPTHYHDNRRTDNTTSSLDFFRYNSTINNEFRKVGEPPQTKNVKNASPEQASSSSYNYIIVDGKHVIVDESGQWYKDYEKT